MKEIVQYKRNPTVRLISNNLYINEVHLFNCGVDAIKILEISNNLERELGAFSLDELEIGIKNNGGFVNNNINSLERIFYYLAACNIFIPATER